MSLDDFTAEELAQALAKRGAPKPSKAKSSPQVMGIDNVTRLAVEKQLTFRKGSVQFRVCSSCSQLVRIGGNQ